jgi:hypothetical protein
MVCRYCLVFDGSRVPPKARLEFSVENLLRPQGLSYDLAALQHYAYPDARRRRDRVGAGQASSTRPKGTISGF